MDIAIATILIGIAAYLWIVRASNAQELAAELDDVAQDVRLAARRMGIGRLSPPHPVDQIEDPRVAAAGLLAALLSQDGLDSEERRGRALIQMQTVFGIDRVEAMEISALGGWMAQQCGTPSAAVSRLSRQLYRLTGEASLPDLMFMIESVFANSLGGLPRPVLDSMTDIHLRFGVR